MRTSEPRIDSPVIDLKSAVITSRRDIDFGIKGGRINLEDQAGVLRAALLDRKGEWISRALVSGFADGLDGLASTYNTTTHLLVMGLRPEAMAKAAQRVRELGGGIVIAHGDSIIYELPLPITGMMSDRSFLEVVRENQRLSHTMNEAGYEHHDILYTLLFLTCDFLPALRLTPLGLLDVKASQALIPVEKLAGTSDKASPNAACDNS